MVRSTVYVWLGLLAYFAFTTPTATVAQAYSSRSIRVIVPGAAGGVLDTGVRKISGKRSQYLGQPVIVDNRLGANEWIHGSARNAARNPR
jgi:tripartite-type tricarboxylate transporter receptor subunit TctC